MSNFKSHFIESLVDSAYNEFDGSDDPSKLMEATYGVVIERESESWVLAANTPQDIAAIELASYTGTEGWYVSGVFELETGHQMAYKSLVTVTITVDGQTYEARSHE